jgi:glutathione S-transferase
MKLYSMMPQDCSGKVRWLLLEMGLPFEEVNLDWDKGDLKSESYLAKQPVGQVPYFEDGDLGLFESNTILSYLADKYADKGFAPGVNDLPARARFSQWLNFSTNTAEKFFHKYVGLANMSDAYRTRWEDYIANKVQLSLKAIEKQMSSHEYFLGTFSIVDISMGYALNAIEDQAVFSDFPKTKAYFERLKARPACLKSEIFKQN